MWNLGKHSNFSIKSYYNKLAVGTDGEFLVFPVKLIGETKAFPQNGHFCLGSLLESILMIDMLKHRGKILVNHCYLCKMGAETCNHILLWWPLGAELGHCRFC